MSAVAAQFQAYFEALHHHAPFPWQTRLAETVCAGDWPAMIALPTASGKTACADIAIFALAMRGAKAPRRIFFVVDRRVVVSEAFLRMSKIAHALAQAKSGILCELANRLRELAGDPGANPVNAYELRGGAYRDESWVRSPRQPALIAATIDQIGSRLLFRGYGISPNTAAIHAALIANDSLIILDEAHCSQAFSATLRSIARYRGSSWAPAALNRPFHIVEMTATPDHDTSEPFRLDADDEANPTLHARLHAPKPVFLREINARRDDFRKLAQTLVETAMDLAAKSKAGRVAVVCNRVRTAQLAAEILRARGAAVDLAIGRMRPLDRDYLYETKLRHFKSGAPRNPGLPPAYVVATQSLEVGADLDFDVLVTEAASLDAILQRFGRLNRIGDAPNACGAILATPAHLDAKSPDPIYGQTIPRTWSWLQQQAGPGMLCNLSLQSLAEPTVPATAANLDTASRAPFIRSSPPAPILLPAHLDALAQTSPPPNPSPDIALFLHGAESTAPEVQIVWRSDLSDIPSAAWPGLIRAFPPVSTEAMPVRLWDAERWLRGDDSTDPTDADIEGIPAPASHTAPAPPAPGVLVWRSHRPEFIPVQDLKPGNTIILPHSKPPSSSIGHIPADRAPNGRPMDLGDQARFALRRRVYLRIHPNVIAQWPAPTMRQVFSGKALETLGDLLTACGEATLGLSDADLDLWPGPLLKVAGSLARKRLAFYPGADPPAFFEARLASPSQTNDQPVTLARHTADVEEACRRAAAHLAPEFAPAFAAAARWHDAGKSDLRFQAMLRGGDSIAAQLAPVPLAKSGLESLDSLESSVAAGDVRLPRGFRHELLSAQFAARTLEEGSENRDLVLHLIASHHGRCRPFPPVVLDLAPGPVEYQGVELSAAERSSSSPHHLAFGASERFWRLLRRYGWWGLAHLEATFRLADWQASDRENAEVIE